ANNGYEIKFVDDVANIYGERTMYLLSDEELHFGSGGTNDKMILHSDGSLSVGTQSSGGYKLAVDGTIGARELVVTQDTWSDFVFEDEFKLKSLEEVEKFIKNKKHLPDIPSEKDVLAKGVSVGEMQKLLLQKIEELTLYVIDLKKQNTEQDKLIADLRNIVQ
ncbi:hypothetical protein KJ708_09175, partial [bacterium]|nr:hypothetical protein [bacterium]